MLSLNSQTIKISSIFRRFRNDITIYTEDKEKDKEFYVQLLRRLVGDSLRINDVTPLGNRKNVINHCKVSELDREVFIIDGDLSVINSKKETLPKLFVLNRYCIENFLIQEDSVVKFLYNACGLMSESRIKEKLNFHDWLETFVTPISSLFINFAIADYFDMKFDLYHAQKYCQILSKDQGIKFNSELVFQDVDTLKARIIKHVGENAYSEISEQFTKKWTPSLDTFLTIVSGKSYLLPLLQSRSREFTGRKDGGSTNSCKINLVQHCDLTALNDLKDFLRISAS